MNCDLIESCPTKQNTFGEFDLTTSVTYTKSNVNLSFIALNGNVISCFTWIFWYSISNYYKYKEYLGRNEQSSMLHLTHLWTQWAAVATKKWFTSTPPHWYPEMRMCACQGNSPNLASSPPMILLANWDILGVPQPETRRCLVRESEDFVPPLSGK